MPDTTTIDPTASAYPRLQNVGFSGMLISFSATLSESANRAALAFRDRIDSSALPGITETATSLTSTYVAYDPTRLSRHELHDFLLALLASEIWEDAALPDGRRLWRIPAVFGGEFGPQLAEAATLAGLTPQGAIQDIAASRLRVMTIGFAPGQPYLGSLSENWGIARQSGLTKQVPVGAIAVAIRQLVLFTAATPTGWRQIAQTPFRGFRPDADTPFALRPGDEVQFSPISEQTYADICAQDTIGNGGAQCEPLK